MARALPGVLVAATLCAGAWAQHLQLPPLKYAYDALEPHIDEATMKVHHSGACAPAAAPAAQWLRLKARYVLAYRAASHPRPARWLNSSPQATTRRTLTS